MKSQNLEHSSEKGFSYIDLMIAMVILMVGILALLSALTMSVVQARGQAEQLTAKQIATSTMESIMSVKETDPARMGWPAVGNVVSNIDEGGVARGIFLVGAHAVHPQAGPDEVLGTADDTGDEMPLFQRTILIEDLCDPERPSPNCPTPGTLDVRMRSVTVTVTYMMGQQINTERVQTILTDYYETEDE